MSLKNFTVAFETTRAEIILRCNPYNDPSSL
jgi:hypothetical protein